MQDFCIQIHYVHQDEPLITKDRIEWVNHNDSVMAKARELLNAPEYTTQLDY